MIFFILKYSRKYSYVFACVSNAELFSPLHTASDGGKKKTIFYFTVSRGGDKTGQAGPVAGNLYSMRIPPFKSFSAPTFPGSIILDPPFFF